MLWYYNKISEDDNSVLYAYGWKPDEITGQLKYNKSNDEYSVVKIADNDTQKGAEWALTHLVDVKNEGFPEKTKVMIG